MATTLSLLVIRCSDVLASKRFYEALGLEFEAEQHGTGPAHWSCHVGEVVLELYPAEGRPPAVGRLGFTIDDLAKTLVAARAAGGRVVEESVTAERAVVVAPDGRRVELLERPAARDGAAADWQVWRQDDNGNRAVLQRDLTKGDAERVAREFEARGHKQMYWASRDA